MFYIVRGEVKVISGADSSNILTIDPTSKAARTTLYRSDGTEVNPIRVGYSVPITIRQTSAIGTVVTVWAMRVDPASTKNIKITALDVSMMFDGTAAAVTTPIYGFFRFSTATPTGGTASTVISHVTGGVASNVFDVRFLDTGLTTTGIVSQAAFNVIGVPISVTGGISAHPMPFSEGNEFMLRPGEGLLIANGSPTVIGVSLRGRVTWYEEAV